MAKTKRRNSKSGDETATCNADCTAAACGDGIVNAVAGEACDTAGDPKVSIDWDAQPLGVDNDVQIAHRLGVSATTVRTARIERGIPSSKVRVWPQRKASIDWDAQPLGAENDVDIAHRLGVSTPTVRNARIERNIPPCTKRRSPKASIDWDAQPLGVENDVDIAHRLGVSVTTVRNARLKRNIPPSKVRTCGWPGTVPGRSPKGIDWSAQPLGQLLDTELAINLGVSRVAVYKQRKKRGIAPFVPPNRSDEHAAVKPHYENPINWDMQPLGKISDRKLARELGVSKEVVRKQRKSRGVTPSRSWARSVNWDHQPLGKIPDSAIAKRLNVSRHTVTSARTSRGIEYTPETQEMVRQSLQLHGKRVWK